MRHDADTQAAQHVVRHVIGVTGSPGVGKSSLVDRLAVAYRQQDRKIGIIAKNPDGEWALDLRVKEPEPDVEVEPEGPA